MTITYTKLINDLSGEVKLISTKELTKDLINECSILNGLKCLVEDGTLNYLYINYSLKIFKRLLLIKFEHGNLKKFLERVSRFQLHKTVVSLQN